MTSFAPLLVATGFKFMERSRQESNLCAEDVGSEHAGRCKGMREVEGW